MKKGFIYILTNKSNGALYTGVTSDLVKRVYEHKSRFVDGFCKRYNTDKLVYFEQLDSIQDAIAREKQIKAGSRKKKLDLIIRMNPGFHDLYKSIL